MRKVAVLSALTLALTLAACGTTARTPVTETPSAPAPVTQVPALDLRADAAVLERTGLVLTLVGTNLTLTPGAVPISVRLRLPDGSYSPSTGGATGQALTSTLHRRVSAGMVVEVGQAFFEPAATVVLRPPLQPGTGTVTVVP